MNNKKTEYTAVNCRVPNEVYDSASELTKVTQKSIANLVANAITAYVTAVTKGVDEIKNYQPLKIDQFAWSLNNHDKPKSAQK